VQAAGKNFGSRCRKAQKQKRVYECVPAGFAAGQQSARPLGWTKLCLQRARELLMGSVRAGFVVLPYYAAESQKAAHQIAPATPARNAHTAKKGTPRVETEK
jgi:hypothetical protein